MKKYSGFNLIWVIIIIVITAIISSVATGVIMLNGSYDLNENKINIEEDKELVEFIKVYETLISKYYDNIDKEGMLNAAEEAMLKFLGDEYTTYLNDKEYQDILDELSGEYNKIGLTIDRNIVLKVAPLSASSKAGIKKGDKIISINNTNVEYMTSDSISDLIKDDNNAKIVEIEIYRDGEYIQFILEKDVYPSLIYQIIDNSNIGYIYIKSFSQNLSQQVSEALIELESKGINSLIIDVRDNVGGYLSAAEETSSLFLEKGKTIYSLESNNSKFTYHDETSEKREYPIVVLMNNNTASASEILAAALKYSYNAILVGYKSYGKGKVQQVVSLNNGDSVKYTSARWLTPTGICIDGIGLTPDYNVMYIESEIYDSQITKAIELLQ